MVEHVPSSGAAGSERRQHVRRPVQAHAELHHHPSQRRFRCRYRDASGGGAKLLAPPEMPAREGQVVRLRTITPLADDDETLTGVWLEAVVVRVDRGSLITDGALGVALQYQPPGPGPSA